MEFLSVIGFAAIAVLLVTLKIWDHRLQVDSRRRPDGSYAYYDYPGIFNRLAKRKTPDVDGPKAEEEGM